MYTYIRICIRICIYLYAYVVYTYTYTYTYQTPDTRIHIRICTKPHNAGRGVASALPLSEGGVRSEGVYKYSIQPCILKVQHATMYTVPVYTHITELYTTMYNVHNHGYIYISPLV